MKKLYDSDARVLSHSPELFDFTYLGKEMNKRNTPTQIIYPDPPLGKEEMNVMHTFDPDFQFVTPLMLAVI